VGWRGRTFHLNTTSSPVYDSAGNGLPTAWWNGRIVGGWAQRPDGSVVITGAPSLPRGAVDALKNEAKRLTDWLDRRFIRTNFQQPANPSGPGEASS
jgi:DNA glycosylase AlkZ-like